MSHRTRSNICAAVIIVVMAFFFWQSFGLKQDAIYPRIITSFAVFLSVITIIESFVKECLEKKQTVEEILEEELSTEERAIQAAALVEDPTPIKDIVVLLGAAFISLILWKPLSFILAAGLCLLALLLYKKTALVKSIIISIITVLLIQLIFKNIFIIPLPSPAWWPYF